MYGPSIESHPSNLTSNLYSIVCELNLLKNKGFNFLSHYLKRIGDGFRTQFWQDRWPAGMVLRDRFPRLFMLETEKEVLAAVKMGTSMVDSFRWNILDGVERHQFLELNSMFEDVSLSPAHDRWCCDLSGDGEFRVKEVRNIIDDLFLPSYSDSTRWVKYIPIKINVFAWRDYHDCLPTRSNLNHRGVILDSVSCPLCQSSEENHSSYSVSL